MLIGGLDEDEDERISGLNVVASGGRWLTWDNSQFGKLALDLMSRYCHDDQNLLELFHRRLPDSYENKLTFMFLAVDFS